MFFFGVSNIDAKNFTVYFVGNNTYDPAFKGLYQVKYADEVDDVTVYVNGTAVTLTAEK